MIDLATETVIRLSEAPEHIPPKRSGKRVHKSAFYRWASRGCRGIVLETLQTPGDKLTSIEALGRFFARLTHGVDSAATVPPRTSRQRRRAEEAADKRLAAAGA